MTTLYMQIHNILKGMKEKRSPIHIENTKQWNIDDWVLVDRYNLQVTARNDWSWTHTWLGPCEVQVWAKLPGMLLAIATQPNSLVNYLRSCSKFQKGLRIATKIVEGNSIV